MIRIRKPATPPVVLTTKGAAETARLCAEYDAHRAEYRAGTLRFEFDRAIYGDSAVKAALLAAQYGKCAFCEAKIMHVMYGDVEHFRPKGGFQRRGRLMTPGYYWLAYDWDNVLIACQLCNQRHKRNAFPLAAGSRRARSHRGDVSKEAPRFVNPAREEPAEFIAFREHVAVAPEDNRRGRVTIRGLGLNRSALTQSRERFLKILRVIRDLAAGSPPTPERAEAERLLAAAVREDAEYAAMARAFLNPGAASAQGAASERGVTAR